MADANILVQNFLLQDSALVALLGGQNIFSGDLPEKYNPELGAAGAQNVWPDLGTNGPAITVCTEGGAAHPEIPMAADRVKVRVWCGINQFPVARRIYNELQKFLHGPCMVDLGSDGFILSSLEVVRGQDLTDPDTGWATVISFFRITARDSAS